MLALLRRSPLRLVARIRPPHTIYAPYSDVAPATTPAAADLGTFIAGLQPENAQAQTPATPALPWDYQDRSGAPAHRLHCHSTRGNTINTFTDPNGNVLAWFSGGSCGFKKRNRSSYEAGYQCAVRMFEQIQAHAKELELLHQPLTVDLFTKGFGQGRDALFKALVTAQGNDVRSRIVSITDRTAIKIGGTRAKKRKRR